MLIVILYIIFHIFKDYGKPTNSIGKKSKKSLDKIQILGDDQSRLT